MDKRKILFPIAVICWGLLVALFTVYYFFPYQRALKVALQNVIMGSSSSVSVQGISTTILGVKASELLIKSEANGSGSPVMKLTDLDITWNPFSLLRGRFGVKVRAAAYGGRLVATIDDIPVMASSTPHMLLKLENFDASKLPQLVSSFKGLTGILNGEILKEFPQGRPETQRGSFRLTLKDGEIREIRLGNMPRLTIPYRTGSLEGVINGQRIAFRKIVMNSEYMSINGVGTVENRADNSLFDIKLSYVARKAGSPLPGKGQITIVGVPPQITGAILPQ